MFNIHLTANLLRNIPVKKIVNRLRLDRVMAISRWPRFFVAHPVLVRLHPSPVVQFRLPFIQLPQPGRMRRTRNKMRERIPVADVILHP